MRSIGAVIKNILRKLAAAALVPIEIVVNGIRQILWRRQPLVDQALDEADDQPSQTSPETKAARTLTEGRESVRVQNAARCLLKGEPVPKRYLDPAFAGDARKLEWLSSLSQMQLGIVAAADIRKIDAHLNGVRSLPMSLVTDFDDPVEEKPVPARVQANANDRGVAVLMELRKNARARSAR